MSSASSSSTQSSSSQPGRWSGDEKRDEAINAHGWGHPTSEALQEIASHSPIIEVCAGSGKLAADLRTAGADVIATDSKDTADGYGYAWHELESSRAVIQMDAVIAAKAHADRTLLMVWPPYNKAIAVQALTAYQGNCLLYVGEARGGYTASNDFFDALDAGWVLEKALPVKQFRGIKDMLWVLSRKAGGGRKIPNTIQGNEEPLQPYHITPSDCLDGFFGELVRACPRDADPGAKLLAALFGTMMFARMRND